MKDKINVWQPIKIGNIEIKNRFVRSATNEHLGTLEGIITDEYINVYKTLAKNKVGMLITSHMAIDKNQIADSTHIRVSDERNKEKLRKLTSTVHEYRAKIIAQISYPGHHGSKIEGQLTKTPSGIGNLIAMTTKDIKECIEKHHIF